MKKLEITEQEVWEKIALTIAHIEQIILTNNNVEIFYQHEDGYMEKVSYGQYIKDRAHFINGRGEYNRKKLMFSSNVLDPIEK